VFCVKVCAVTVARFRQKKRLPGATTHGSSVAMPRRSVPRALQTAQPQWIPPPPQPTIAQGAGPRTEARATRPPVSVRRLASTRFGASSGQANPTPRAGPGGKTWLPLPRRPCDATRTAREPMRPTASQCAWLWSPCPCERERCASFQYGRSTSRSLAALLQIPNLAAASQGTYTRERFVGRPSPARRISRFIQVYTLHTN
jgi:hypothetical protein